MDPDFETWRDLAFSEDNIVDFLRIIALPAHEAERLFHGRSAQMRCFGVGFYFFVRAIRAELNPQLGDELHTLACRVEQTCLNSTTGNWRENALDAEKLLIQYFPNLQI